MSKQTAVEWLFEQMLDDNLDRRYELFQEALAMEREQIEDAFEKGLVEAIIDPYTGKIGNHYYNETYKGGEQ